MSKENVPSKPVTVSREAISRIGANQRQRYASESTSLTLAEATGMPVNVRARPDMRTAPSAGTPRSILLISTSKVGSLKSLTSTLAEVTWPAIRATKVYLPERASLRVGKAPDTRPWLSVVASKVSTTLLLASRRTIFTFSPANTRGDAAPSSLTAATKAQLMLSP